MMDRNQPLDPPVGPDGPPSPGRLLPVAVVLVILSGIASAHLGLLALGGVDGSLGRWDRFYLFVVSIPTALVQLILVPIVFVCVGDRALQTWESPGRWLVGLAILGPILSFLAFLIGLATSP